MANSQNIDHQNGLKQAQAVVVMVPFPAQGHLNQLLHLSRLVSAYNLPIHYVGTTTHNRQAKLRVHGWDPLSTANIRFHEFLTPSFLSPSPNPNNPNKFPSHLMPSLNVSSHLREPVASLLRELAPTTKRLREPVASLLRELAPTTKRLIVIYDSLMAWVVQDLVSLPNVESYDFHSCSAFFHMSFYWERNQLNITIDPEIQKEIPSIEGCFSTEFFEFIATQTLPFNFHSGNLYNTSKIVEGPYFDFLAKEDVTGDNKHWAIGPFNPVTIESKSNHQGHRCLEWLEKQDPNSVIYISFGTTNSLSDEQIKEIAIGLGKSDQKFIWVLRDADKGDVFVGGERKIELPKGFEERVREKGIVVREWAPQLEILGHPSTGGFMSHCGWNSCMESITMGVPIAAWPMHSDQPRNAVLVTKFLKIGVVVKDWDKRDELISASTVESAVKRLMCSEEGAEIRKRAEEMGSAVRGSVEEGGVSRLELDSFIAHITR